MAQNILCLVILLMTDISLSAPTKNQDPNDETENLLHVIPRPEAKFDTHKLQGDVLFPNTANRNADPCVWRGCKWPKHGSYVIVPYYISSKFSQVEQIIILGAPKSFEGYTCIRFVPYSGNEPDYIHFESLNGVFSGLHVERVRWKSFLGRQNGGQYISLEKGLCLQYGTVQHEILHALGFHHEQSRSDRDHYVWIYDQNIMPGEYGNFKKQETNNLGTPYDFPSIMHYGKYDFSKNGLPTIVAKAFPNYDWGRAWKMNTNDIARVNILRNALKSSAL